MTISFTIPLAALPKQGDRSRVVTPRNGKPFVAHYIAADVKRNAEALAIYARQHRPTEPMRGPLALDLIFAFPWRKNESKRTRQQSWEWRDTKPDYENLAKQIGDVLEDEGFFATGDGQVCDARVRTVWAKQASVQVCLREMVD